MTVVRAIDGPLNAVSGYLWLLVGDHHVAMAHEPITAATVCLGCEENAARDDETCDHHVEGRADLNLFLPGKQTKNTSPQLTFGRTHGVRDHSKASRLSASGQHDDHIVTY